MKQPPASVKVVPNHSASSAHGARRNRSVTGCQEEVVSTLTIGLEREKSKSALSKQNEISLVLVCSGYGILQDFESHPAVAIVSAILTLSAHSSVLCYTLHFLIFTRGL